MDRQFVFSLFISKLAIQIGFWLSVVSVIKQTDRKPKNVQTNLRGERVWVAAGVFSERSRPSHLLLLPLGLEWLAWLCYVCFYILTCLPPHVFFNVTFKFLWTWGKKVKNMRPWGKVQNRSTLKLQTRTLLHYMDENQIKVYFGVF